MKLDDFTKAYIETALGSSTDDDGNPLDGLDTEISEDTLAVMGDDCLKFQHENAALLSRYYEELPVKEWSPEAQAGHDFWLSRNGHGAGFFDRDAPKEIKDKLQSDAEAWGTFDLYIGDDGLIHA